MVLLNWYFKALGFGYEVWKACQIQYESELNFFKYSIIEIKKVIKFLSFVICLNIMSIKTTIEYQYI